MGVKRDWRTVWRRFLGVGFALRYGMLRSLRRRMQRDAAAKVSLVQGDGRPLPFRVGAFDVVFLVAVLGVFPDPAACVAACTRVLRDDGLLSITAE